MTQLKVTTTKDGQESIQTFSPPYSVKWDMLDYLVITQNETNYTRTTYIPKSMLLKVEIIAKKEENKNGTNN